MKEFWLALALFGGLWLLWQPPAERAMTVGQAGGVSVNYALPAPIEDTRTFIFGTGIPTPPAYAPSLVEKADNAMRETLNLPTALPPFYGRNCLIPGGWERGVGGLENCYPPGFKDWPLEQQLEWMNEN